MKQLLWKMYTKLRNPTCTIQAKNMGRNVKFGRNVTLSYNTTVCSDYIGDFSYINAGTFITKNVKSIGKFCSIAPGVQIGLNNHPTNWVSSHSFAYSKHYMFRKDQISFEGLVTKPSIIGNDVWIGSNVTILAGVNIGHGAIIGANSLVNKDVEPYQIVAGSPAKPLRKRFDDDLIEKLLQVKWWDWDHQFIKKNIDSFNDPKKIIQLAKEL